MKTNYSNPNDSTFSPNRDIIPLPNAFYSNSEHFTPERSIILQIGTSCGKSDTLCVEKQHFAANPIRPAFKSNTLRQIRYILRQKAPFGGIKDTIYFQ